MFKTEKPFDPYWDGYKAFIEKDLSPSPHKKDFSPSPHKKGSKDSIEWWEGWRDASDTELYGVGSYVQD